MIKFGDIGYFNDLHFCDSTKDIKEKRPCIILCSLKMNKEDYFYCVPLTSKIRRFNKFNSQYILLSTQIKGNKLSFFGIEYFVKIKKSNLSAITGSVSLIDRKNILKQISEKSKYNKKLKFIKEKIVCENICKKEEKLINSGKKLKKHFQKRNIV